MRVRLETERGRRLDRAFGAVAADLDARERAFTHELSYGTTRLRGRLDHLLARHVHRDLQDLDEAVLEVLRLGAYQLLYMDGVPAYAAVSSSVDQAQTEVGQGAAGLVNAVLRKVGEAGDDASLFPSFADDPAGFLSTWGSHPRWVVERWLGRWSASDVRSLVDADNRRPPVYLVPLDEEPDEAVERLGRAGLGASVVGEGSRCVRLDPGVGPAEALAVLPHAVVQDPAANVVAAYADVPTGTKVADLCAAPGGKALAVSERPLYTLAADRSEARLRMVRDNAVRCGRTLGFVVADARTPPLRAVDVVLLDAPCSGTGTFARRPDARWRLTPESIDELSALQADLLAAAADIVVEGGLLVYSTCTLEPEENESRIDAFLSARPDFSVEATEAAPRRYVDSRGLLVVTPTLEGFDGAFAARLRRAA